MQSEKPDKTPVDLSTIKVLSDSFFISASRILITFLKPIRTVVFGKILGPHLYGIMNIAPPYIQILTLTSNVGFNDAMSKLVPGYMSEGRPEMAHAIYRSAGFMNLVLSLMFSILAITFANPILEHWAHQPDAIVPFRLYLLIIPFIALNAFYSMAFITYQKGKAKAKITMFYGLLNILLPIGALLWRRDLNMAIAGLVITEGFGSFLFFSFFRRRIVYSFRPNLTLLLRGIREIFSVGYLFFFSQLGWNLINSVDRIMVKLFMTAEHLGYYTIGALLITALSTITSTIGVALVPSLSAARTMGDTRLYEKQVHNLSRIGYIAVIPLVTCIFVIIRDVIMVLLPRFEPSIDIIRILVFIGIFDLPCRIAKASLVACGRGGLIATGYIAIAIWNIIWNWLLIPRFGTIGAAAASVSSYFLLALVLQIMMRLTSGTGTRITHGLYPLLLACVYPALGFLLPWGGHIVRAAAVFTVGSLLYAFLLLVTGLVDRRDLEQAGQALEPRSDVMHVRLALRLVKFSEAVLTRLGR